MIMQRDLVWEFCSCLISFHNRILQVVCLVPRLLFPSRKIVSSSPQTLRAMRTRLVSTCWCLQILFSVLRGTRAPQVSHHRHFLCIFVKSISAGKHNKAEKNRHLATFADVISALLTAPRVFFFWTHFRLSLWTTMHLRMRRTTPSVYLDLCEGRVEHDRAKRLPRRLQLERERFLRWFLTTKNFKL